MFVFPTLIPKKTFCLDLEYTFKLKKSDQATCNALLSQVFTMYMYTSSIIYRCRFVILSGTSKSNFLYLAQCLNLLQYLFES